MWTMFGTAWSSCRIIILKFFCTLVLSLNFKVKIYRADDEKEKNDGSEDDKKKNDNGNEISDGNGVQKVIIGVKKVQITKTQNTRI